MKQKLKGRPNGEGSTVARKTPQENTSTTSNDSAAPRAKVKSPAQSIQYVRASALLVVPVCRGRRDVYIAPAANRKSSEALRIANCA